MGRVSRSAIVARKTCETKCFRTYHQNGTGMVPTESIGKLEAIRGTAAHKLMELAALGQLGQWRTELEQIFAPIPEQVRQIQLKLCHRAMLGWYRRRWPLVNEEYEVMSAEGAWDWLLAPDVMMPLRMDRILRSRKTGHLAIFDFKFIGSMDLNWRERHSHTDQTQLYIQALKEKSGETVEGIIYDAIIVGQWDHKRGQQKSPFVSAYDRGQGDTDADRYSPDYVRNKDLVSTIGWDDRRWMNWAINTTALDELYITSGLLLPTSRNLLATKAATVVAQRAWDLKIYNLDRALAEYGPQSAEYQQLFEETIERNPESCLAYGWEKKCEHYNACWVHPDSLDGYVPRVDHHPRETGAGE